MVITMGKVVGAPLQGYRECSGKEGGEAPAGLSEMVGVGGQLPRGWQQVGGRGARDGCVGWEGGRNEAKAVYWCGGEK